ncbi:hypothetical protein QAD02_007925 [Eretmocerus hayati]|uniref:Uncharacterized protein n=1 Tax=Eretmocerus hayati TaxID=131215 RepID=A0ACC2N517_9HYME|nr:hypothetical protein QAD02_007925 [Eretmocerus hayati]
MALSFCVKLENASVHVVPSNWLKEMKPMLITGVAWPVEASAEERWRLARERQIPGQDWGFMAVRQILASTDEYDDSGVEVAALKAAFSPRPISDDDEHSDNDEGYFETGLSSLSGGNSADSGFCGSSAPSDLYECSDIGEPSPKRRKLSIDDGQSLDEEDLFGPRNLEQRVMKAPTAKLLLTVRLASEDRTQRSEVLTELMFKLPADTGDGITSEVIIEVMPKDDCVVVENQDDVQVAPTSACRVAWAKRVPRECFDDPHLGAVLRDVLAGDRNVGQHKSSPARRRSNSI